MANKKESITRKDLISPFSARQYMVSKDFEVYYYNELKACRVAPHTHDYYEFYFFVTGDAALLVGNQEIKIKAGDFCLIPPGTKHCPLCINPDVPYRRFILWISENYCSQLLSASKDYVYLMQYVKTSHNYRFSNDSITFHTIESKLFALIGEMKNSRFGKGACLSLLVNDLILYLNRLIYEKQFKNSPVVGKDLSGSLQRYIDDHLGDDLSLEHLEQVFFVSRYYLSHTFKDSLGISIHSYITKKRLYACRDALVCKEPVTAVFERFGFSDYSNFYRAFKKEFGISPKEYQQLDG